jgi:alpha-glucosidase
MISNVIKLMSANLAILCSFSAGVPARIPKAIQLTSPDNRLTVEFHLNVTGAPRYVIRLDGKIVLLDSSLGLVRDDADFSQNLRLLSASPLEIVRERYEILTAKRRVNNYRANRKVFHLQTAGGQKMDIIFQVSNDGVAFRYYFPETNDKLHFLEEEASSFHCLPGTLDWLQPMSVAKSGWESVNPCYEEFYKKEIPVGTPSPIVAGWVYPALFRSGDTWLVVSETALGRNYSGTRLRSESPGREYRIGFPDQRESFQGGPVNPQSKLPWLTPWRIIAVGNLKTITESMLGLDLADKPTLRTSSIKPGKASWSWPLLGENQTTFDLQKRFASNRFVCHLTSY